jgi:hypothetical protein
VVNHFETAPADGAVVLAPNVNDLPVVAVKNVEPVGAETPMARRFATFVFAQVAVTVTGT